MTNDVEIAVRGPGGYVLAGEAFQRMQALSVWPTPLNYELWLHCAGDPHGALARDIERLASDGKPFTDEVSERLAAAHLPRLRLSEEIRDAGAQLSRELKSVASAMAAAQQMQEAYGRSLAGASADLAAEPEAAQLRTLVSALAEETRKVGEENATLEKRLEDSIREVTNLREHLEQVRRDAMTDALTLLANRKSFDERLIQACASAEADGQSVAVAVMDIDHFKRFNDTWGHQTGDQVIRFVGSVIGRHTGAPRFAARWGGEEFAILFLDETAQTIAAALETIREEIGSRALKRRSTNEDLGAVTISAGYAQRRTGESAHLLMERADEALYASKHAGRNRVSAAETLASAA